MKKLLIGILIFGACVSTKEQLEKPRQENTSVVDFTKYSDQGFIFSPSPPTGSYSTKGIISVDIESEVIDLITWEQDEIFEKDGRWYSRQSVQFRNSSGSLESDYYGVEVISLEDVLDKMMVDAKEIGANAVYSLKYNMSFVNYKGLNLMRISASGTAVDQ